MVRLYTVFLTLWFAAAAASTGAAAAAPNFDVHGQAAVRIPATFGELGIIVPVVIQGRRLDFVLDSGASHTAIDAPVARQLGLRQSDYHKAVDEDDFNHAHAIVPEMSVGDLRAYDVPVFTAPWGWETDDNRKAVGLLGSDFFRGHRVDVNFKDQTVTVLPESDAAPGSDWTALDIDASSLVPMTHAKFNAVDGRFVVDLGSFRTILYPNYFSHFAPKGKAVVQGEVVGIRNEAAEYKEYTFSRFDLGPLAFADAAIIVASGGQFQAKDYDGVIGRDILSNFDLLFDYANGKLYVKSFAP